MQHWHSLKSCKTTQRRRDAAGELILFQVQVPAGHANSHGVTPLKLTDAPPHPASRPQRVAAQHIASIKSNQIKSNQIKSNQIKSNQINQINQIKSNQIKIKTNVKKSQSVHCMLSLARSTVCE
jgi:hypothetical protein